MTLRCFEIEPQQPHSGSVIWLHGLGASEHDFEDVVPELAAPSVRFVFPAAPQRAVTINAGWVMPAWYDVVSFDEPPLRESEPDVREAASLLDEVIQREVLRGVPPSRIVLLGFSQGGAMALHAGVRAPEALAGVGVLSGYMVLPQRFDAEHSAASRATPLFFGHGLYDPVVGVELGRQAFDQVTAAGYRAEFHTYPMQHALCVPEIGELRRWLHQVLAG